MIALRPVGIHDASLDENYESQTFDYTRLRQPQFHKRSLPPHKQLQNKAKFSCMCSGRMMTVIDSAPGREAGTPLIGLPLSTWLVKPTLCSPRQLSLELRIDDEVEEVTYFVEEHQGEFLTLCQGDQNSTSQCIRQDGAHRIIDSASLDFVMR